MLRAVLAFDLTEWTDQLIAECLGETNLEEGPAKLGAAYLKAKLNVLPLTHVRIGAAQASGSVIGPEFYRAVLRPAWQRLAEGFDDLMSRGKLVRADPWLAVMHWRGLNERELFERSLLGDLSDTKSREIKCAAIEAADAFLKIYGGYGN